MFLRPSAAESPNRDGDYAVPLDTGSHGRHTTSPSRGYQGADHYVNLSNDKTVLSVA